MADREARQLLAEADKKASQPAGWFGLGGPKLDDAADLYQRAGNSFKLNKLWKESGDAYQSQANVLLRLGEKDEAATAFINASKSYKKSSALESITALESAVKLLIEKGRFSSAASNQKQVAEMFETDVGDVARARDAYEKAAEWYQGEESNAQADGCFIKAATLAAQLEDFESAVGIFEDVASRAVDGKLTKWSVKEYLFKAGICLLNIRKLTDAVESGNVEDFTNSVVEYDRISKLDAWKTSLLLRVKKTIGEEDEDLT
ncbi:hypothetical protein HDU83_006335 [Entophlyctis luteolus]|nr:hypothetical protein HDU83_006335 [Entophlyctis luteolus]